MANHIRRQTGIAYLVMDPFWYGLPREVRDGAYWGFHTVYKIGGKRMMELKGVDQSQVPNRIDFVDAVVQVHASPNEARSAINTALRTQLRQLPQLPQRYRNQSIGKLDIGVAFALKDGSTTPPICVSEAVVSLNSVFGWWKISKFGLGMGTKRPPSLVAADAATRTAVGRALGRTIAHEVWHQLWWTFMGAPPYGRPHRGGQDYEGLEAEGGGANWCNDGSRFSKKGEEDVLAAIPRLDQLQGREETQFLGRRSPIGLLGSFPGVPRSGAGRIAVR